MVYFFDGDAIIVRVCMIIVVLIVIIGMVILIIVFGCVVVMSFTSNQPKPQQ